MVVPFGMDRAPMSTGSPTSGLTSTIVGSGSGRDAMNRYASTADRVARRRPSKRTRRLRSIVTSVRPYSRRPRGAPDVRGGDVPATGSVYQSHSLRQPRGDEQRDDH